MNNDREFSIKETVNKNVETVQFPAFNQHNSLLGWCSMNYPRVLQNPLYMPKPKPKVYDDNLDNLYQMRAKEKQNNQLCKPFTNFSLGKDAIPMEGIGVPPPGFKKTLKQLTTAKPESKALMYEQTYKDYDNYLNIKPISSEFGEGLNPNYSKKIRQVGEVYYVPSYESEDIRHLKKLPNSIITEQNLMTILNFKLKYLNLHNHTWIKLDQISKIGYFAPNIEELIISNMDIDDDLLIEIAKSCPKLQRIDISSCPKITERGIRVFLDTIGLQLQGFRSANNLQSISDYSLEPLQYSKNLKSINVSFCNNLTANFTQYLLQSGCRLMDLQISTVENLQSELMAELIAKSKSDLEYLDISFIPTKDINDSVLSAIGMCQRLQVLIMSGNTTITDSTLRNIGGLPLLTQLKLGGLQSISENSLSTIVSGSQLIKMLELNNVIRLSENGLDSILKSLPNLEILSINFTPEISDNFLNEKRAEYGRVNIIRNINKMTDPKDDGLRMPLPLESVVMQRPKKKKKKK